MYYIFRNLDVKIKLKLYYHLRWGLCIEEFVVQDFRVLRRLL